MKLPRGCEGISDVHRKFLRRLYEESAYIEPNPEHSTNNRNSPFYRMRAAGCTLRGVSAQLVSALERHGFLRGVDGRWRLILTPLGAVAAKVGFSPIGVLRSLPEDERPAAIDSLMRSTTPLAVAEELAERAASLGTWRGNGVVHLASERRAPKSHRSAATASRCQAQEARSGETAQAPPCS